MGTRKPLAAWLKFAKKHLNNSQIMRNKIPWSDLTKNAINDRFHLWRKLDTNHQVASSIPIASMANSMKDRDKCSTAERILAGKLL